MTQEKLNLEELTEQTYIELETEITERKKLEVKRKIRYIYERTLTLKELISYHEKQINKCHEGIEKATNKIEQIKKGNWDLLNQINPDEKLPQIPKEE